MSYPDGGTDDVDYGCCSVLTGPSISSDSDVSMLSPSPGAHVQASGHPLPWLDGQSSAGVPGAAGARPCEVQLTVAPLEEVRSHCHPLQSIPPPLFDWEHVDAAEFARLKVFLGEQPWAIEFYDEDDGFHVAIEGILEEDARTVLNDQIFHKIPIHFVTPSASAFEQCCDIKPGDRLKNTRNAREGLYSGSVGCSPNSIFGFTAAHTIIPNDIHHPEREEIRLFNQNVIVSRNDHVIKEVNRTTGTHTERITTDVRLLQLEDGVSSRNEIHVVEYNNNVPNGTYMPTVYEDVALNLRRKKIALRNNQRRLIDGFISHFSFSRPADNLFNTIIIGNNPGDATFVIEPGDSGALVWLVPPETSEYVKVVGIVIGRLGPSEGVVNSLGDFLRYCPVFGTSSGSRGFYDHS